MEDDDRQKIRIECARCKKRYSIDLAKLPAKRLNTTCKKCGHPLTIPSIEEYSKKSKQKKITGHKINSRKFSRQNMISCPKCSKHQPMSPECIYCGVILFKNSNQATEQIGAGKFDAPNNGKPNVSESDRKNEKHKLATSLLIKKAYTWINKLNDKLHSIHPKIAAKGFIAAGLIAFAVVLIGFAFSPGKMTSDEIVAKTENAVALIKHSRGNGSGFVIDRHILATNYHVIESVFPEELELYFPSAGDNVFEFGRVIYFNESRDLALVEIKSNRDPLPISSGSSLRRGEDLVIIGSPGITDDIILENSITRGTLSSEKKIAGHKFLQISASINPGNSGGPALNYNGEVVAIITLKASEQEGITFGLPVKEIVPILDDLRQQSIHKKARAHDKFIACTLYKRLLEYAYVNLTVMDIYIEAMNEAIKHGGSANDGLNIVAGAIDEKAAEVNRRISPSKINKYLRHIHQSEHVEPVVKENLLDLWKCAKEIYDYVDSPRGNLTSYTNKRDALYKEFEQAIDTLRIRLNIEHI
jgi:predicted Zn finger-like uncharacterized protein